MPRTFALFLSLVLVGLFGALEATRADAADLGQARERALRSYGWRPEAIAYIVSNTRLIETIDGRGSPCPTAVSCSVRDGAIYLNQVPGSPTTLDYVLNHEYIHAIQFARGSADANIGPVLADLVALSNDEDHAVAANAARRVLGLTARDDHTVIREQDWYHIDHYLLEDVGWDTENLPGWYRDAYFPYLAPGAAVRKSVTLAPAPHPQDEDLRTQVVLDAIVRMCGPVLPGAHAETPSVACDRRPVWSGVPYPGL
jgi:hypothetical protein